MLIALVAGALLGVTLGTVGGGGAVLAVPVLVYLLDQPVHVATTTSLVVVAGAAGAGVVGHARRGAVCWRLAAVFAAAAIPGSIAGTAANQAVGGAALLGAFSLLLLAVAAVTWKGSFRPVSPGDDACPRLRPAVVIGSGIAVGLLTGLFGVGGGFAVVPALALALRVPFRRAIATSLAIVTAVSIVSLVEHLVVGAQPAWGTALPFAAAAMVTASLGGRLAARLPRSALSRIFAMLLVVVAVYLLISITLLGGPPGNA